MVKKAFSVTGGSAELELPRKAEPPTDALALALRTALDSVTAYHPQALTTYTYYEVLDAWLGPWGVAGYPLGYGKYYNILFTTNPKLCANSDTLAWVEETTLKLQEALTDFVLKRFRAGSLGMLTEAELRRAAFESHPRAYTDGGLAKVAMLDLALLPIIMAIPGKEFDPRSQDFGPTIKQVLETAGMVAATGAALGLAALMPAHSGFLQRAADADRRHYIDTVTLGARMGQLKASIASGDVDYVPWLDQVISSLNRSRFDSQDSARCVRDVVLAAEQRKKFLLSRYEQLLEGSPKELRGTIRKSIPEAIHGP